MHVAVTGPAQGNRRLRRSATTKRAVRSQQLVGQIRDGRTEVVINPLMGGLSPHDGWNILRLLREQVLPEIVETSMCAPAERS